MNEKEQALFYQASDLLERIFSGVPADCTDVRLGVRVWFERTAASDLYYLTDYLYYGGERTRVRYTEQRDQLRFTQGMLDAALLKHGWTMGQPTRRNTTEFVYNFKPTAGHPARQHNVRVFNQKWIGA